ncbi:MAG: putative transporter [Methanoregula sp. PtaU1.Bin051]|nr:MAG: putative transporter [Methanoregula sp. PtaU1.Bin051]
MGAASPDKNTESPAICHVPDRPVTKTGKLIILFIAVLAGFLTPFDGSAVNVALPAIGTAFHMDAVALSWVATAYLLSAVLFLVPFGKIADIYGRKKIFLIGITIFGAASFLMTLVPSAAMLIAVRIIQGFGASMIYGTSVAIVTSVFPPGERGKALGIYTTAVYLGLTVGPFLGGIMTDAFGWRSIFYINIPIAVATVAIVIARLEGEWLECEGEKFDLAGSVLYGLALVAVMYGFSELPSAYGGILILAGIILAVAFVLFEQRQQYPVLSLRLFSESRVFTFSSLAALINYSATFAVSFLLSLYLQYTKGFSPEDTGIILVAAPLVQAAIAPFAGRLSDRIEPGIIASAGMGISTFGVFMLVFLSGTTPLWYIVIALVVLGAGFGLFSSPNTNAIMSSVKKKYYGVASGIVSTMRLLGQMLSMGIATMTFAIVIGRVEITPELYPEFNASIHYAFIIFTVLCLLGIYASLIRHEQRNIGPAGPAM